MLVALIARRCGACELLQGMKRATGTGAVTIKIKFQSLSSMIIAPPESLFTLVIPGYFFPIFLRLLFNNFCQTVIFFGAVPNYKIE